MGPSSEGAHGIRCRDSCSLLPRRGPAYHKAVGFIELGESSRSDVPQDETPILTRLKEELEFLRTDEVAGNGTNTVREHESESNLIGNECQLAGDQRSRSGSFTQNRVKKDPEKAMIDGMYQAVRYSTKKGFINMKLAKERGR